MDLYRNGTWTGEHTYMHFDAIDDHLIENDVNTGRRTVISSVYLIDGAIVDYSPDRKYVLQKRVASARSLVWSLTLLDMQVRFAGGSDNRWNKVASMGQTMRIITMLHESVLFGPHGSQVAFVSKHNLYYKPTAETPAIQLTKDGSLFRQHGICGSDYDLCDDERRIAVWFSANGKSLAWATFEMQLASVRQSDTEHVKSARTVSVNLWVVDVRTASEYKPNAFTVPIADDHLLAAVHWTSNNLLVVVLLDRLQQYAYIHVCTDTMSMCTMQHEIELLHGWLRFNSNWPEMFSRFGPSGDVQLALIVPLVRSLDDDRQRVHVQQVATYSLKDPRDKFTQIDHMPHPLQAADDDIHAERILHWDSQQNVIFFVGSPMDMPHFQHLYAIVVIGPPAAGGGLILSNTTCMTCLLRSEPHEPFFPYTHFSATFNHGSRYLVLESLGPRVPRSDIIRWGVAGASVVQQHRKTMADNPRLKAHMRTITPPLQEYERVQLQQSLGRSNRFAHVKLTLPVEFFAYCGNTMFRDHFAMVVRVYAEPGTYAGQSEFSAGWEEYMAVNQSVVFATVDARGSSRQPLSETFEVHGQSGFIESVDLREVTK